ncbi:MAG: hypothetical protein O3C21_10940 [Verrucomicrobia bacterium]|nr:hypothetical protein [Verrucomicrobiota bacterium]
MKPPPSPEASAYADWIASLPADERAQATALGVAAFDEPSYFGRTLEDWQTDRIEAPAADPDANWDLKVDLLAAGIEESRLDTIVEIFTEHANELAAEAMRRLVDRWRDSKVPRIAGLLRHLNLHQGESIRQAASRCKCSPSTIHEHQRRFRDAENRTSATL